MFRSIVGLVAAAMLLVECTGHVGADAPEPPAPQPSAVLNAIGEKAFRGPFSRARLPQDLAHLDEIQRTLPADAGPVDRALLFQLKAGMELLLPREDLALQDSRQAAAAWREAGDGPGVILGTALAGALLYERDAAEGRRLMEEAVRLARTETRRPKAALTSLETAAQMGLARGPFGGDHFDPDHPDLNRMTPGILSPAIGFPVRFLALASVELRQAQDPASYRIRETLSVAGTVAMLEGDLEAARRILRRKLELDQKYSESAALSETCLILSYCDQGLGSLDDAEADIRKALETATGKLEPSVVSEYRIRLGELRRLRGDFAAAREIALEVWRSRSTPDARPEFVADALLNLMVVAISQADLSGGEEYGRKMLEILDGLPPTNDATLQWTREYLRGTAHLNLGVVAMADNRLPEARRQFEQMPQRVDAGGPPTALALTRLINLGVVDFRAGKLDEARKHLDEGLKLARGPARAAEMEILCLMDLGSVAVEQGDLPTARRDFEEARRLREQRTPDSPEVAAILHGLALVARKQGSVAEAARLELDAWKRAQKQPLVAAETQDNAPVIGAASSIAAHLALCQTRLGQPAAAFATVEASRASSLRRLVAERRSLVQAAAGDAWGSYQRALAAAEVDGQRLRQAVSSEQAAQDALQGARSSGEPRTVLADWEKVLASRTEDARAAREAYLRAVAERERLAAEVERKARGRYLQPLTLREARCTLPGGTLAAIFSVGEETTQLFLLRAEQPAQGERPAAGDGLSVYQLPIGHKDLGLLVAELRQFVTSPVSPVAEATAQGRKAFRRLFPGAAGQAVRSARRLLICPDDALWDLPFAALVTNEAAAPHYLGATRLTLAQSLTLFDAFRREPVRPHGVPLAALVVGDPGGGKAPPVQVASAPPGERALVPGSLVPLPGASSEAREVASLYGTEALVGPAATEAAVRKRLGAAGVVHFATHGLLNPDRAMSSGVVLAPPAAASAGTDDDGLLQAWEVFSQLHLRAELVVLSACESGRGASSMGSGLVGMTRALQYAGVRSVVASQWRISDAGSRPFMVELHRGLRRGQDKDAALSAGAGKLRARSATAHPYYWAGFILMGDPVSHGLAVGN